VTSIPRFRTWFEPFCEACGWEFGRWDPRVTGPESCPTKCPECGHGLSARLKRAEVRS